MSDAKTPEHMSPELRKVAERARRDPNARIIEPTELAAMIIDELDRARAQYAAR